MWPAAALRVDRATLPLPAALEPAVTLPRPAATRPAAAHKERPDPGWPRAGPRLSPPPADRAAPSASHAAWSGSPAAAEGPSARSDPPARVATPTPAPSWSALRQTRGPHPCGR